MENLHDQSDDMMDDKYNITNALVLIICISKYNGMPDLESVKMDMEKMTDLWQNKFKYTVIANKVRDKDGEYFVDDETIDSLIGDAKQLLRNTKNGFDAFIFIYSGHGYNGGIITSETRRVSLTEIEKEVSPKKLKKFKDCPKIFIIDACRSRSANLPFDERLKEIKADTSGKNQTTKWHHPLLNTIEVFGNTQGYSVFGSSNDGGGSLLSQVYKTFDKYISKNIQIFDKKTFQGLFNPIKRKLHKNQDGNQVVEIQDRLNGIDVFISPSST